MAAKKPRLRQSRANCWGKSVNGQVVETQLAISAQVTRVPILDGHTALIAASFAQKPSPEEALAVLEAFTPPEIVRHLPTSPERALIVHRAGDRPQPRRDRDAGRGMSASVGRVRACPVLDLRLVALSHNTIRGAAGGAILNAELLVASGIVS